MSQRQTTWKMSRKEKPIEFKSTGCVGPKQIKYVY